MIWSYQKPSWMRPIRQIFLDDVVVAKWRKNFPKSVFLRPMNCETWETRVETQWTVNIREDPSPNFFNWKCPWEPNMKLNELYISSSARWNKINLKYLRAQNWKTSCFLSLPPLHCFSFCINPFTHAYILCPLFTATISYLFLSTADSSPKNIYDYSNTSVVLLPTGELSIKLLVITVFSFLLLLKRRTV